jgi:hypothetical protein
VTCADDIRSWVMALPEVEETSHFRFRTPVWKVRGRTFLGMGKDGKTAVFCVSEQQAHAAAAADPGSCAAVRRQDARRSFLGLEVVLDNLGEQRLRELAEMAWRQQAPRPLAAERDRGT